jgi:hypothetical protein
MQELDISRCKSIDASTVAKAIADNKTLSRLVFGGNMKPAATLELAMVQANFSNKNLGSGGATIITAWLTHKDNGALMNLDLASNNLNAKGAKIVAEAIKVRYLNVSSSEFFVTIFIFSI